MSEEITLKLYRTSDLTEAAALSTLGHGLQTVEVAGDRATFVVGYSEPEADFWNAVDLYQQASLLVEAREFARRRNEVAAKMRRALVEALPETAAIRAREVAADERA